MTKGLQKEEKQEAQVATGVERIRATRVYVPQVDIYTGDEGIVITADMPGVGEDDVDITLEKNVLMISGYVSPLEPDGYELAHSEYGVGDYQRSFTLSDEIDQAGIEARLNNGVLVLTLPKAPEAKARKISVSVG
jgi:HSP20 family molecular chaperone IbpA